MDEKRLELKIDYEILYNGDNFDPSYNVQLCCYHPIKKKYVDSDDDIWVEPGSAPGHGIDHDFMNHNIRGETTSDFGWHENRTVINTVGYNSKLNIIDIENSVKLFQLDENYEILADYDKRIISKLELIKVTIVFEIEHNEKEKLASLINGNGNDFLSSSWHTGYQKNGWTVSVKPALLKKAKRHEKLLEFDEAAEIYKKYGMDDDVIRVRAEARNKVEQTVVHGDYVDDRDTIVKDSVLNRSNVGVGGDDKFTKLKELTEMKEKGFIDDDEFKQMKKEILGK